MWADYLLLKISTEVSQPQIVTIKERFPYLLFKEAFLSFFLLIKFTIVLNKFQNCLLNKYSGN